MVCIWKGVDLLEGTGLALNLILNGRQHLQRKSFIGRKRAFRSFHFLTLRETEIDIKAGRVLPAHAYCPSVK